MVESFRNGEREARVALEDARQSVTLAERKRVENETAMERARELLSRQRAALQEIKETIFSRALGLKLHLKDTNTV